jgi:hypothetical protein
MDFLLWAMAKVSKDSYDGIFDYDSSDEHDPMMQKMYRLSECNEFPDLESGCIRLATKSNCTRSMKKTTSMMNLHSPSLPGTKLAPMTVAKIKKVQMQYVNRAQQYVYKDIRCQVCNKTIKGIVVCFKDMQYCYEHKPLDFYLC